jgi:hypothetical protein
MPGAVLQGAAAHQPLAASSVAEAASRPQLSAGGTVLEKQLAALVNEGVIVEYCVCSRSGHVLLASGSVLSADLRADPTLAGLLFSSFAVDADGADECRSATSATQAHKRWGSIASAFAADRPGARGQAVVSQAFCAVNGVFLQGCSDLTARQQPGRCPALEMLNGRKLVVVRRTMGSLIAVSRERRDGVIACTMPANMLLLAAFRRPWVLPRTHRGGRERERERERDREREREREREPNRGGDAQVAERVAPRVEAVADLVRV